MNNEELAAQQPADNDQALECMKATLEQFHAVRDRRASFLRVYYIMTQQLHAAVNRVGDFAGHPVFADPDRIRRLSGRFASTFGRWPSPTAVRVDGRGRSPTR
jgi:hypothetical protein